MTCNNWCFYKQRRNSKQLQCHISQETYLLQQYYEQIKKSQFVREVQGLQFVYQHKTLRA